MQASIPRLKSMTWTMENRGITPANRVAVITLKVLYIFLVVYFTFGELASCLGFLVSIVYILLFQVVAVFGNLYCNCISQFSAKYCHL